MRQIFSLFLFCALSFLLTGCMQSPISAQTEYITRQGLASYIIGTPDPNLNHPVVGQRLIIKWSLPDSDLNYSDLHMEITLRFYNGSERSFALPICKTCGTYIYSLPAEDFCQTEGIASFKFDLMGDGCVLYMWRHQLWVDLINVS